MKDRVIKNQGMEDQGMQTISNSFLLILSRSLFVNAWAYPDNYE